MKFPPFIIGVIMPNLGPVPGTITLVSTSTSSNAYAFSTAYNVGTRNQLAFSFNATLAAGVTSAEFKIQSCSTQTGTYTDWPYFDEINGTIVNSEYVVSTMPYVVSIATSGLSVGPINIPGTKPWWRVAYKITGVGTGTLSVLMDYSVV